MIDRIANYRRKIATLTSEELKQREKYLRDIASGKVYGPMVGYPSIDMPQLANYIDEPIRNVKYDNIYDLLFKDREMSDEAIVYLGGACVWTLGQLKKRTDQFIKGFLKAGVQEYDNVLWRAWGDKGLYLLPYERVF